VNQTFEKLRYSVHKNTIFMQLYEFQAGKEADNCPGCQFPGGLVGEEMPGVKRVL